MPFHRIAALGLLLATWPVLAREKDDVVVMSNGDHLHGEIKSMTRGKLDLSTSDLGRLSIEWVKVARITSTHIYEVTLTDFRKYYGPLVEPPPGVTGYVDMGAGTVLPISDVVAITLIDDDIPSRIRANLDLGFTLARSRWAFTFSGAGAVDYRSEDWGTGLEFDSYFQTDESNVAVSRTTVVLTGLRFFTPWELGALLQFDKNDELNLRSRYSLGGGAGYRLVHTNTSNLVVSAGLAGTRELYVDKPAMWALDAYGAAAWETFQYDSPKLDLGISGTLYPGLTNWGRLRGSITVKVRYELFSDFNVGLTFNNIFDTRPPDPTASNYDFIAQFTIGWKYHR